MSFKKFFYAFTAFLIYFSYTPAEYIIVFNDGQTLQAPPREMYNQIYNTLLSYQFPVCTWHNNQAFNQLCEQEKNNLLSNEQAFIEQKLKEINPQLRLIFLPTILYEWFFYVNYQTDPNLQKIFRPTENGDEHYDFDESEYPVNKDEIVINTHACLNNLIIENLKNFINLNNKQINIEDCKTIFDQLSNINKCGNIQINEEFKNIIKSIIDIEFQAIQKNSFVLYRATNGYENYLDKIIKGDKDNISLPANSYLSYGNSFLSGIIFDKGASVGSLICKKKILYAVFVEKRKYLNPDDVLSQLFWVAPLMTLVGLHGEGENFHSRTYFFDKRDCSNISLEENFQNFLAQNVHIIKNISSYSNEILLSTNFLEKNGSSDLHLAILENNIKRFRELLRNSNIDINIVDNHVQTPLHMAIFYKKIEFIEELLAHNANINAINKWRQTVFVFAKKEWRREPWIDMLPNLHNFPNANTFFTQVMLEVELEGAVLTRFPEEDEKNNEILFDNYLTEQSKLFWQQYSEIIKKIDSNLYNMLNPNKEDNNGQNIIDYSKIKKFIINLPVHDNYERTILFSAISQEDNIEYIEMLLHHGADVNVKEIYLNPPLHAARSKEIIRLLLRYNTDLDVKNIDGDTPLHLASSDNNIECLTELLDQHAGIEAKNNDGETPLHVAAANKCKKCLIKLLSRGANINAVNSYNQTPLDVAKQVNNSEIIEILENYPKPE